MVSNRGRNTIRNRLLYFAIAFQQQIPELIDLFILITFLTYPLYQGNFDRFISYFNQDKVTAKDVVYQTENVKVYKFKDGKSTTI